MQYGYMPAAQAYQAPQAPAYQAQRAQPVYQAPSYQAPRSQPMYQAPVYQQPPAYQPPVAQRPVYQAPPVQYQQPQYQQPQYQQPQPQYQAPAAAVYQAPAYQPACPQPGCGSGGYQASGYPGYPPQAGFERAYTLDAGDRLRVTVFGQEGLTNSYAVDAAGYITMPLIGAVPARGLTTDQLSQSIAERLRQGYIREPHVALEIEAYRPFFILGEVGTPGQYAYVANMTVENAIAIAGGFGPRADKSKVTLTRNQNGQQTKATVGLNYQLRPGDTLRIPERWF
jgi:polysaccharide export outer membrane protein